MDGIFLRLGEADAITFESEAGLETVFGGSMMESLEDSLESYEGIIQKAVNASKEGRKQYIWKLVAEVNVDGTVKEMVDD